MPDAQAARVISLSCRTLLGNVDVSVGFVKDFYHELAKHQESDLGLAVSIGFGVMALR